MTTESVNKWWPEIEALKAGKTIQRRIDRDLWEDTADPSFIVKSGVEFRIKPEPRELWVLILRKGIGGTEFQTEEAAKKALETINSQYRHEYEIIHYREVL